MQKYVAEELLRKKQLGILTKQEQDAIDQWILFAYAEDFDLSDGELAHEIFLLDKNFVPPLKRQIFNRYAVAAAALLLICFGLGYFLYQNHALTTQKFAHENSILPGSGKAVLTLADGKQVDLSSTLGVLSERQGVSVSNSAEGLLVYRSGKILPVSSSNVNRLAVPRGGEYRLVLADGTKVFLNAASSLSFPTVFAGKSRIVELTGEAYFEVAHNPQKPFEVRFSNQSVQVLGTHFNISAYPGEKATTTLLEGSIRLQADGQQTILKPGQKAFFDSQRLLVSDTNGQSATAWKNGYFQFENEDIHSVMSKLSRWYDIQVSYSAELPTEGFYGEISRYKDIKDVLHILEATQGVHFRVRGREVIVMK